MHPQLETLLEIQDLRAQFRSLEEAPLRKVEEEVFALTPDEARDMLELKIGELADELETGVRQRYDAIEEAVERVVVPVLSGVCYGCYVAIPTAWSSRTGKNDQITNCTHCGRFLYYLD